MKQIAAKSEDKFSPKKLGTLNDFMEEINSNRNSILEHHEVEKHEEKEDEDFYLVSLSEEDLNPFGRPWLNICQQIKENSPFRNFETYAVAGLLRLKPL